MTEDRKSSNNNYNDNDNDEQQVPRFIQPLTEIKLFGNRTIFVIAYCFRTNMTTTRNSNGVEESTAPTTRYEIHFREHLPQRSRFLVRWVAALWVPVSAVGIGVLLPPGFSVGDVRLALEKHGDDGLAKGCLLLLLLSLLLFAALSVLRCGWHSFCGAGHRIRDTELSLTVCPLGIQRSRAITTTTTSRNGASDPSDRKGVRVRVCDLPFLPMESVRDCILLEHVGGFSVSTHVMIRLHRSGAGRNEPASNSQSESESESELVSAFPDADMTFDQCHGLVQQIQRALGEMR